MRFSGKILVDNKLVAYDLEVYPNYFLAAYKRLHDGKIIKFEAFTEVRHRGTGVEPSRLSRRDISMCQRLMRGYKCFGFNSRNYDLPIILAALKGYTTAELYKLSCTIIKYNKAGWMTQTDCRLYDPKIEANHFDIEEPAPAVMVSLKLYMARLNAPKLQDLPYPFDTWLTRDEANKVSDYCGNDLDGTELLFNDIRPRMELRETLSNEYGINLMSKSDAQISEAIIKFELAKLGIKTRKSAIPKSVYYTAPKYVNFKDDALNVMLDLVNTHEFMINPNTGKFKLPKMPLVTLGLAKYKMGIGGLHSREKAQSITPTPDQFLIDSDAASYYPAIILGSGLAPKSLGKPYLKVYEGIVNRRLRAKELNKKCKKQMKTLLLGSTSYNAIAAMQATANTEDKSLKITINGNFGKLGSKHSFLYAPDLLLAATITGQLALLMLIERVEAAGLPVVSANTDGFVTLMDKADYAKYRFVCKQWEAETGFDLEETYYKGLYSRDVNNYVAITLDGDAKGKGVFKKMGVEANPKAPIIAKAVQKYFQDGTPPEDTIDASTDVTDFVSVQRVNGGCVWKPPMKRIRVEGKLCPDYTYLPEYDADVPILEQGMYLGRVARWLWVVGGSPIYYLKSGNKVAKSDGARPLMELAPIPHDLDYARYYFEVEDLLKRMGVDYHVF